MKIFFLSAFFILVGCSGVSSDYDSFNNKNNLNQLIDAYAFLSDNHDLLHIMMGEYAGSPLNSFNNYKNKIILLEENLYIKPIILGLDNIKINQDSSLANADRFDSLVDYYQMGIQMMIDGIIKGYGYDGKMPQNSKEYKEIKKIVF